MNKIQLLVLDDYEGAIASAPAMFRLKQLAEVTVLDKPLATEEYAILRSFQFVLAIRERTLLDTKFFQACESLELLLQTGGHAYHVDAGAATTRGIVVALGRNITTPKRVIPELVFAFILGLVKQIDNNNAVMKAGNWPSGLCGSLFGRTIGILGYGRLGKPVAEIAKAFGMQVIVWDRKGETAAASEDGVRYLPLPELLAESDVVSIHLRLSEESRGLLNRENLSLMKPGALLINTSRGAIIDEEALIRQLTKGELAGAGLDVFQQEPLPRDSKLRTLNNVLLTPHIGWRVPDLFHEFTQIAADHLAAWLAGKLAESEILNPAALGVEKQRHGGLA